MKKINLKLSILIIALIVISVTGCKKMEEVYACDPVIDEWVKANLAPIQKMNRQDLLELDIEKQRPAYRAFTSEQKYRCWMDKIEQVRSLEWTEKELAHICLLAENIKLEWFEDNSEKNIRVADKFLNKWISDGYSYFGWTKNEIGFIVAYIDDVEMEDGYVILAAPSTGVGTGSGYDTWKPSCGCSTISDWCFIGNCVDTNCQGSAGGCGTLWQHPCDARCNV